jgi:hypothetical protein
VSIQTVLDSRQADRIYINPPAQGEGHFNQEGTRVGGAHHDLPAVLAPQPSPEAGSRANQVHAGAPAVYLAKSVLFGFGLVLYFPDDSLNLPNEHGQIRLGKTHLRRGEAVVFDVWGDVLVMRMCALQSWIIWVRMSVYKNSS